MSAGTSPFAIDASAVAHGLRTYADNRGSVMAYVDAINAVDLGVQHYDVAGLKGEFDPFKDQREAADALEVVQGHTTSIRSAAEGLHASATQARQAVGVITDPLKKMQTLLEAIGEDGTPTDQQAADLRTQLYFATWNTKAVASGWSITNREVAEFIGHLGDDYNLLTKGVAAVGAVRARLNAYALAEAGKYMGDVTTRPIGEMIAQLGGKILGQLDALGAAVANALVGHVEMRAGVSALATAADTVATKVSDLETQMKRLDNKKMSNAMRLTRIEDGLEAWDEYGEFLSKSGL